MKPLDQRRLIDAHKLNHTAKAIKKFVPQGSILEQLMNFATSIPDFFPYMKEPWLMASFSLKYWPISEIKFVPLFMGMEVFVICFAHYKFTKILPHRQASMPFYFRWLRHIY